MKEVNVMSKVVAKECSSQKVNFRKEEINLDNFTQEKEYLAEEIKVLEKGEYSIVVDWNDVEAILESFEDNEEFEIEELENGMFAILPTLCLKKARKEFDKLPKAK